MIPLPPEVIRMICGYLSPKDAAALRLVNKTLSSIASYFLVSTLRFHTSQASLERLQGISKNDSFRHTITSIIYEGCMLPHVGCPHAYAGLIEPALEQAMAALQFPGPAASRRELRLFQRNRAKIEKEMRSNFGAYRASCDTQHELLDSDAFRTNVCESVARCTQLQSIRYLGCCTCSHAMSQRFQIEFDIGCQVPLATTSQEALTQLQLLFDPAVLTSYRSVKRLSLDRVSAKAFADVMSCGRVLPLYQQLTYLYLDLELTEEDTEDSDIMLADAWTRILRGNVLNSCLGAAVNVEYLTIIFQTPGLEYLDHKHVSDNPLWPKLRRLTVECISFSSTKFVSMLEQLKMLQDMELSWIDLTDGTWADVIEKLRWRCTLRSFVGTGVLRDPGNGWNMTWLCAPSLLEQRIEETLADCIDDYVCDSDIGLEDQMANPLRDMADDFDDADALWELADIWSSRSSSEESIHFGVGDVSTPDHDVLAASATANVEAEATDGSIAPAHHSPSDLVGAAQTGEAINNPEL